MTWETALAVTVLVVVCGVALTACGFVALLGAARAWTIVRPPEPTWSRMLGEFLQSSRGGDEEPKPKAEGGGEAPPKEV